MLSLTRTMASYIPNVAARKQTTRRIRIQRATVWYKSIVGGGVRLKLSWDTGNDEVIDLRNHKTRHSSWVNKARNLGILFEGVISPCNCSSSLQTVMVLDGIDSYIPEKIKATPEILIDHDALWKSNWRLRMYFKNSASWAELISTGSTLSPLLTSPHDLLHWHSGRPSP